MADIDPGEAGAIKSHDHYRASLQVIRRFCLTVSFFAVWVMARQQLDPMLHFGATLRARDPEPAAHRLILGGRTAALGRNLPMGDPMAEAVQPTPYIGRSLRRREDYKFLTGKGRYVDDIKLSGTLHMAILRSPHAHVDDHPFNDIWCCRPKKNARPYSSIDPVHKRNPCLDASPLPSLGCW
jgi:hypothetical protein